MKRIFSIFVATLLLSTTLLAQNVAKVDLAYVDELQSQPVTKATPAFTVNGIGYSSLAEAMEKCSEQYPVVFCKDYTTAGTMNTWKGVLITDGKDYYFDLNGKTLTTNKSANTKK